MLPISRCSERYSGIYSAVTRPEALNDKIYMILYDVYVEISTASEKSRIIFEREIDPSLFRR